MLAGRALAQGVAAGNWPVALRAARILEKKGQAGPEARLLLTADALRTRHWKRARTHVQALAGDDVFGFMAPILDAWIAQGSGKGDPLKLLGGAGKEDALAAYTAEHRPLLLLAGGRKEATAELLAYLASAGPRAARLRMAAAATLANKGRRKEALALLEGEAAALVAARRLVESGKPLPGAISGAPAGAAEFFLRMALDLSGQKADRVALSFARLATFLAPDNSAAWLVTGELLGASGEEREALTVLAQVSADDPFAGEAIDARVRLLSATGRKELALQEAEAATRSPTAAAADWARLGEAYSSMGRHEDAAKAYAAAIERSGAGDPKSWWLWMLRGGALEQAGNWPEGKAALQTAYKLAPEQPLVLNYLGYAQLTRRENIEEAMALIAKASKLQPDSPEITDSLGWAHFLRGNVGQAIELLERAAKSRPADPEINEHLGDAYYKAGRRFEARYAWQAALLTAEGDDAERLRAKIDTGLTAKHASP